MRSTYPVNTSTNRRVAKQSSESGGNSFSTRSPSNSSRTVSSPVRNPVSSGHSASRVKSSSSHGESKSSGSSKEKSSGSSKEKSSGRR